MSKKRVHTKQTTLPFVVRNEQRFQNRYSNIFQFQAYDRFLCSQSLHGIVRNQEIVSQAYETSVSKKRLHTKQTTLPFVVRNEQRFQNRYSNIFQFQAYDRFLCSQSLHGIVRNQEIVSQAYETSVSKKRLHTKRTTQNFVVGNEQRFPLLLGTNNTLRIFMVLSETKSALVTF